MAYALTVLCLSIIVLTWSASKVAESAQNIVRLFRLSPMLVGLTMIALGTSAPELVVSAISAYSGNTGIAIGNGLGSNMVNTGVVLGLTLLSRALPINVRAILRELVLFLGATILAGWLLFDNEFNRYEGALLFLLFPLVILFMIRWSNRSSDIPSDVSYIEGARSFVVFVIMMGLLLYSANRLIGSVIDLAEYFNWSDLWVSATVVAVGTSLPELVISIAAIMRGSTGIAFGGILGSNIFNIFGVLGLAGVLSSTTYVNPNIMPHLYLPLAILTVVFLALMLLGAYHSKSLDRIVLGRLSGMTMLITYVMCVGLLKT